MTQDAPPSLSDHAYAQLLRMLETAELAPNERLLSEERLARQIGVSRPVLRSALKRLRNEKRIYSRKGSGHYVSAQNAEKSALAFSALGSIADVRDFLRFRLTLEVESAVLAAQAGVEAHAQVMLAHRQMAQAFAERRQGIDEDLAFHITIARVSGNRFYELTMTSLAEQMRFAVRLIRDLSVRPPAVSKATILQEHAVIEAAIASGDPERARKAMETHLRGGISRLFGDKV